MVALPDTVCGKSARHPVRHLVDPAVGEITLSELDEGFGGLFGRLFLEDSAENELFELVVTESFTHFINILLILTGKTMAFLTIFIYFFDMSHWKPTGNVRFRWGSVFECEYDWSWRVRGLPSWDIWYVTAGRGWIADPRQETEISAGDCLLLRRNTPYHSWHDPEQPLSFIAIHFDLLDCNGERLELEPEDYPPFSRRIGAPALLRELLTRAIDLYREEDRERAGVWLQSALMEALRQDAVDWPAGPMGEQAQKIEEICRRIRAHPGRRVRIEDLASELYVTPEHFSRVFRQLHGMSPRAFLTRTRIEAAQSLLMNSGHSIGRVSELLGYESPFYFSRQFKAHLGVSPSEFRKDDRNGTVLKSVERTARNNRAKFHN